MSSNEINKTLNNAQPAQPKGCFLVGFQFMYIKNLKTSKNNDLFRGPGKSANAVLLMPWNGLILKFFSANHSFAEAMCIDFML